MQRRSNSSQRSFFEASRRFSSGSSLPMVVTYSHDRQGASVGDFTFRMHETSWSATPWTMPNSTVYIMRALSGPLQGWQFAAATSEFNTPTGYQFPLKADNHAATDHNRKAAINWFHLIKGILPDGPADSEEGRAKARILNPFRDIETASWQAQWPAAMNEALEIAPILPQALATRMQTALSMQNGFFGRREGRQHVTAFFGG